MLKILLPLLGVIILVSIVFFIFKRKKSKRELPGTQAEIQPAVAVEKPKSVFKNAIKSWIPLLKSKTKDSGEWERVLIEADMGPALTSELLVGLKNSSEDPIVYFKQKLMELLAPAEKNDEPWRSHQPWVLFLVGVNGVGKTTTIVKLSNFFQNQDLSVGVIGADTFRKAAVEQLERGVKKVGAEFFTILGAEESEGADSSAVVFDGLRKFKDKQVILVDTSGRLHTKKNLMEELKKMKKVANKSLDGAPHDLWLIVDSTQGQNTVAQGRSFHEAVALTGMILTKADGLSRGGTLFQLFRELHLPIRFLGVGEGVSDLKPFKSAIFIEELFDQESSSF